MLLKSLRLRGFKSFASTTDLELTPGICVVVGPNGSGKSNVVDSLTWVMGVQGARQLRGASMEDVIFSGTPQRPALGRAEVVLHIDNSDGTVPVDSVSPAAQAAVAGTKPKLDAMYEELAAAYRAALADSAGDGVVAVHLSGQLSGTCAAAELAAAEVVVVSFEDDDESSLLHAPRPRAATAARASAANCRDRVIVWCSFVGELCATRRKGSPRLDHVGPGRFDLETHPCGRCHDDGGNTAERLADDTSM